MIKKVTINQITGKLKKLFLILIFSIAGNSLFAVTYYSWPASGSDPSNLNNWWTVNNGTGTHPGAFTGNTFIIQDGHTMTATALWAVGTGTVQFAGAASVLDMATFQLTMSTGTITMSNAAALCKTSCTHATLPIPTGKTWAGVVEFTLLTGGQAIPVGTYTNLKLDNTSGTNTVQGDITATTFTTAAGGTTDMVATTLTATTINHSGILKTQETIATPLPSGKTWGGTVEYNRNGNQTVVNGTYNNLSLNGGGGTQTTDGAVIVNGAFSVAAGNTFSILTATTTTLNGTYSNSGTAIRSSANADGTLTLTAAGNLGNLGVLGTGTTQGIILVVGGTTTSITVAASTSVTNLTVNSGCFLKINAGQTFTIGQSTSVGGTLVCNGTIQDGTAGGALSLTGGSVSYSGSGSVINTGGISVVNTSCTKTFAAGSSLTFAVLTAAGANPTISIGNAVTATTLTVNGAITLPGDDLTITANATLNANGGINNSATGSTITNNGTLSTTTVTLTATSSVANNSTATLSGNLTGTTNNSTWNNNNGGTLNIAGTLLTAGATPGTLVADAATNTVNYNGAAQTIKVPSVAYYHLTLSTSGAKTLTAGIQVNGDWTTSGTASLAGNFTVTFGGTAGQNIKGPTACTFYGLTMSNSVGLTLFDIGTTVSNTLTLTTGKITLGNYDLSLTNASGLSGGSSTSYIVTNGTGLFKRTVSGAATYAFPLGSSSAYNPASIVWSAAPGVTRLDGSYTPSTASVGTGLPVTISGCLSGTTLVNNGYWTFANTGALSNTYDITLTRNGHSNAGTTLQDHGIVRRDNSGTAWTTPGTWVQPGSAAISPANTGQIAAINHTGVSTASGFGEFALVKGVSTPPTVAAIGAGVTTACVGATSTAFTDATGGGVWSITNGTGSATIDASGVVTGVTAGTITVNYSVTSGGCTTTVTNTGATVYSGGTATPSVTAACDGSTITLTVAGNTGTKQWEQNVNGGGWVNISGCSNCAGSPVTTAALVAPNTYQYRVKSQGLCAGTATTITTQLNTTTVADAGSNGFACNDAYTLAGNAPGAGETGLWTKILGTGTITTPTSSTSGLTGLGAGINNFTWTITQGACSSSASISITEGAYDTYTSQYCIFSPATVDLSVANYNSNSIQWQQNVNNAGWVDIGGATTTPYTTGVLTTSTASPAYYQYRAKLTTGGCTDYGGIVQVGGSYCATSCAICTSCTCNTDVTVATGGCTWRVTANDATAHTLAAGTKLCIVGGTYTGAVSGTIGVDNGSVIVASGATFTPSSFPTFTGTSGFSLEIQSGGTANIPSNMVGTGSGSTINNCGTLTLSGITNTGGTMTFNNCGTTTNSGTFNVTGGTTTYNNAGTYSSSTNMTFTGGGTFCNSGTGSMNNFTITGGPTAIVNSGTLNITADITNTGGSMSLCPNSTINVGGNITGTGSTITGLAPCGVININGRGTFTGGTISNFDVCDASTPTSVYSCTGCATPNMSYCTCSHRPLPIELISFTARWYSNNKDKVITKWVTASEIGNDHFTIERTEDGETFTEIGVVAGAGNSNSILQYSLIDDNAVKGISYYRLKQTDYDGNYAYSGLVAVETDSADPLKLIYLYPDQNRNSLKYQYSYSGDKSITVEVVDVLGKTVSREYSEYNKADQEINMDISGLNKGVYLFKVSDGEHVVIRKFLY